MASPAEVKAEVARELGDDWDDDGWTDFYEEVCETLLAASKGRNAGAVVHALAALIKYGIGDADDLRDVSTDKREFRDSLEPRGVSPRLADALFIAFVAAPAAAPKPSPQAVVDAALAGLDLKVLDLPRFAAPENGPLSVLGYDELIEVPTVFHSPGAVLPPGFAAAPPNLLLEGVQDQAHRDTLVYKHLRHNAPEGTTVLYGTSGAGKTRSMFELLSHNYGFYYSLAAGPNPAARDLDAFTGLCMDRTTAVGIKDKSAASTSDKNRREVDMLAHALIFVRHSIFLAVNARIDALREAACEREARAAQAKDAAKDEAAFSAAVEELRAAEVEVAELRMTPYLWLLCQLFPTDMLGDDYFEIVLKLVVNRADLTSIESLTEDAGAAVRAKLKQLLAQGGSGIDMDVMRGGPRMLVVVDEAQLLMKDTVDDVRFLSREVDDSGRRKRRSLYGVLADALRRLSITCATYSPTMTGTGMDKAVLDDETGSPVGKPGGGPTVRMFDEFALFNVAAVDAYLSRFLDKGKVTAVVWQHVCKWLCGRPRFAAAFAQTLLAKGQTEPSTLEGLEGLQPLGDWATPADLCMLKYLGRYVDVMTAGSPRSEDNRHSWFLSGSTLFSTIGKVLARGTETSAALRSALVAFSMTGVPQSMKAEAAELIRAGVCAVNTKVIFEGWFDTALIEPLVVEAGLQVLRARNDFEEAKMERIMESASRGGGGPEFEHLTALALWARAGALAADVAQGAGADTRGDAFRGLRGPLRSAYGVIACDAKDDGQVAAWWEATRDALLEGMVEPVLLPSKNFGPDVALVLRSLADPRVLVPVLAQCKFVTDRSMDVREAVLTVAPTLLFVKNRKDESKRAPNFDTSCDKQVWDQVWASVVGEDRDARGGRPVLRVVVTTSTDRKSLKEGFMHAADEYTERCNAVNCTTAPVHDYMMVFNKQNLHALLGTPAGGLVAVKQRRADEDD